MTIVYPQAVSITVEFSVFYPFLFYASVIDSFFVGLALSAKYGVSLNLYENSFNLWCL